MTSTTFTAPLTPTANRAPHVVRLKVFWKTTRKWDGTAIAQFRDTVVANARAVSRIKRNDGRCPCVLVFWTRFDLTKSKVDVESHVETPYTATMNGKFSMSIQTGLSPSCSNNCCNSVHPLADEPRRGARKRCSVRIAHEITAASASYKAESPYPART